MKLISEDKTRIVDDDPSLAIAAYRRVPLHGGGFMAQHVGIFDKPEDAESWIATGSPDPIRINVGTATGDCDVPQEQSPPRDG